MGCPAHTGAEVPAPPRHPLLACAQLSGIRAQKKSPCSVRNGANAYSSVTKGWSSAKTPAETDRATATGAASGLWTTPVTSPGLRHPRAVTFRKPLPLALPQAFSVADAYARGFTRAQMRNRSLVTLFHGTRVGAAAAIPFELRCRALATRMPPGAAFSHRTAAILHGMPLPLPVVDDVLDVTVPTPKRAPRRRGTRGHSAVLPAADVGRVVGVPVTTVERTWCDLGRILDLPDLVAVGDFLLWHEAPLSTKAGLAGRSRRIHRDPGGGCCGERSA